MKKVTFLGITALASLCSVAVLAQETRKAQEAAAPSPATPSPEALARMAPGPMHAKLEPLVGSFAMTGKWRMTPDAPWETFQAHVERQWDLDGRFLREEVQSEWMGQPFEGLAFIGHDNTRQEFTMVWVDNMSTATVSSTGHLEGERLVFEGQNSDPMTGQKNAWSRSVIEMAATGQTIKGYGKDSAGKEFQNMEMSATRE